MVKTSHLRTESHQVARDTEEASNGSGTLTEAGDELYDELYLISVEFRGTRQTRV